MKIQVKNLFKTRDVVSSTRTTFLRLDYLPSNKEGPQGPQKLSSLKSLNIRKKSPILGVFTPATIRKGFLKKILGDKIVKKVKTIHKQRRNGRKS